MNKKKIGILITTNTYGGIAKLSAMMANDIANKNIEVTIFIPIIPYHTYYIKIFNRPLFWIFKIIPEYIKKWIFKPNFAFKDVLDIKKVNRKIIKTKFILTSISQKDLNTLDCIILNGVGDVFRYKDTNIKKKIYLVNQIEEIQSGNKKKFEKIRRSFNGEIITHCNFMKKKLSNHLKKIRVVPNPISSQIWKNKKKLNNNNKRKEILLYWKNDNYYDASFKLIKEIKKNKPDAEITIFARSLYKNKKVKFLANKYKLNLLFDQNEEQMARLYLDHNFLLYPNTYEDFGMPPVEALACGCIPLQRPNIGAADMYSINNYNSIHLTNDTQKDVTRIIETLESKKKLAKLRKNSLKKINIFNPLNYGNRIFRGF